jgi:hypothetical protein
MPTKHFVLKTWMFLAASLFAAIFLNPIAGRILSLPVIMAFLLTICIWKDYHKRKGSIEFILPIVFVPILFFVSDWLESFLIGMIMISGMENVVIISILTAVVEIVSWSLIVLCYYRFWFKIQVNTGLRLNPFVVLSLAFLLLVGVIYLQGVSILYYSSMILEQGSSMDYLTMFTGGSELLTSIEQSISLLVVYCIIILARGSDTRHAK